MAAASPLESERVSTLRTVALLAAVAGASGSVAFLLAAGSRNSSLVLVVVLFSVWVISPFAALVFAIIKSAQWPQVMKTTLYGVTVVLAVISLAIYGRLIDVKPTGSPNTFLFVIVPPVSWAFMVITVSVAALVSRPRRASP